MNFLASLLILLGTFSVISTRGLREEFTWSRISYDWPAGTPPRFGGGEISFPRGRYDRTTGRTTTRRSSTSRPTGSTTSRPDTNDAYYIYQNNIPMGANVWNEKLFITVPRRRVGVPSTLNYIWVNSSQHHNVPLKPYPDWESNSLEASGDKFVSVYRVAVDGCDRLWFVDTGRIETPGNPDQIQPIALVIMDLKTDRVLQRHVFNSSVLRSGTSLASVTVDVEDDKCGDAFAYIPDLGGFGLIVYSLREDRAWRLNHNYFSFEPVAGEFMIGGHRFQWNDGIFSIALSDLKSDGHRDAYFHSMAGFNQYRVSTRVLRNETLSTRSYHDTDFEHVGSRGPLSQTSSSDLHKTHGILFLGLVNQNALACWNIATPLSDISIVHKNDETMIYPSDVKVSGDTIVLLTNTMPVFLYGTLDYDRTNFRVWVESVDMAIRGTKCDKSRRSKS